MPESFIQLTEDEFDQKHPLVRNHINPNASWSYDSDTGNYTGCLFETYGPELEFVRQQAPNTIWTFVDGDDGDQYVINGYHLVNRIGYLISKAPVPEGVTIEVHIPMQTNDDE